MPKKLTKEEFIKRSNLIHNNKFDYSLVEYIGNLIKVKIICPIHKEFEQLPKNHMNGFGCIKCRGEYALTTDRFISFSNKKHKNKYDYSLVDYKDMRTKVKIKCPEHNIFEQTPGNHLKGCGCPSCGGVKVPTTEKFIINANKIHNNKYDYSLVEYKNAKTKVKIICKKHNIFEQTPTNHLSGQGCPTCLGKNRTKEELIVDFNKIHNFKYDYSLVEFKTCKDKVKIICPDHNIFEQTPSQHLSGNGCHICGGSKKKDTEEFIKESNIIHNFKYDYSLTEYKNAKTKVKIICKYHNIFEQTPSHHITGVGCPSCCDSKGEKEIRIFLISNDIKFSQNKRFSKCKDKTPLPFDFYLSDHKTCIEYDGIQHFESIEYFGGQLALESQKLRDQIKTDYCLNNNIKLIRIKYNESILEKLSFLVKRDPI